MGAENVNIGNGIFILLFLSGWIAFAIYAAFKILARKSKHSWTELVDRQIVDASNLQDIYISDFGGRLTIDKYSFPLQREDLGYRKEFNDYINPAIRDYRNEYAEKGKVKCILNEQKKRDYSTAIYYIGGAAIILLAHSRLWILAIATGFILCFLEFIIDKNGAWIIDDHTIQYKLFFKKFEIDLKSLDDFRLTIPEKKLYFELMIATPALTHYVRDNRLKNILPLCAMINSPHAQTPGPVSACL